MAREFHKVGVVGLGTMGAGIAEVFARTGLAVTAVEVDEAALERGRGHVADSTGRAVARGKLSEADHAQLLERITYTTDMNDLADVDLVVEAVPEHVVAGDGAPVVAFSLDQAEHDAAQPGGGQRDTDQVEPVPTARAHGRREGQRQYGGDDHRSGR